MQRVRPRRRTVVQNGPAGLHGAESAVYSGPLGSVPRTLDCVEDATADGTHAEGATDVVNDAPRAGLSVGNAVSRHGYYLFMVFARVCSSCAGAIGTCEQNKCQSNLWR